MIYRFENVRPSLRGVIAVLLVVVATRSLFAADSYLRNGKPDAVALLAPPPEAGSAEQASDLAAVVAAYKARTPAEEAAAKAEKEISLAPFAAVVGNGIVSDKLPKTTALIERVRKETKQVVDSAKDHWKRPRPYEVDAQLAHGDKDSNNGYPSGHSTQGTVMAILLAELYPEKREAILAVGRNMGWHRVISGKHYPTDIYAGRVLGQAIVRDLHKSEDFEKDFAAAKAEIQAAPK
jgi:acid phosphatase (class A)